MNIKAQKALDWIIEKAIIREKWMINGKYEMQSRSFKGTLPRQMTNAISNEIKGICGGKNFEYNGWKFHAESLNKFKGQANRWHFVFNNEPELLKVVEDPANCEMVKTYENWK